LEDAGRRLKLTDADRLRIYCRSMVRGSAMSGEEKLSGVVASMRRGDLR